MSAAAIRFQIEDDPDHVWESPTGGDLPESREEYERNPITPLINPDDDPHTGARRTATYEEYCAYWGNPDRQVALMITLERQCPCCGSWIRVDSLHGITFMDDAPEARLMLSGTYTLEEIQALPANNHLRYEALALAARTFRIA